MKLFLKVPAIIFCCILMVTGYSQTRADEYAKSLSATSGKQYTNVPGTRLFFAREQNMFFTKQVNKMVELDANKQETANVFFYELPFNKPVTSKDEGILEGTSTMQVSGYTATLETYTNGNIRVLALYFGDADFKVLVNARMPLADKALEKKYIAFLRSLVFKKDAMIDCASLSYVARFSTDMEWFGYQSAGVIYGKYAFLPFGTTDRNRKGPRIYITEYLINSVDSVRWVDAFDIPDGIDQSVLEKEEVKSDTLDGFKTYSLVAWIGKAPGRMMIYQTARTNGSITLVFTATATGNYMDNLLQFKDIAASLKIKEAEITK
jgi:hypothetical protein